MSTNIPTSTNLGSALNAGVMPGAGSNIPAPPPRPKIDIPPVQNDAEVVAKVASTVIKPSGVNEVSQDLRVAAEKAAQEIQTFLQSNGRNLNIQVDGNTGYHVVTVTNPETGEVIRQMPSPELLKIAQSLPQMKGLFVDQKA